MTALISELTMTFALIAPQILFVSLMTLVASAVFIMIRRYRESTTSAMESAYQKELERVGLQLSTVQGQLARAFDACENDQDFNPDR